MEDDIIIGLYFDRDERAISETALKYGKYCRRIAENILNQWQDAEECVNDTYCAAWNSMPPQKPAVLSAFLGRITRNLSISRLREKTAKKRYFSGETMLSELSECIPDKNGLEEITDSMFLSELINRWLCSLKADDRALFIRRYWHGDAVYELSKVCGCGVNQMAKRMFKLRNSLKDFLLSEGVTL